MIDIFLLVLGVFLYLIGLTFVDSNKNIGCICCFIGGILVGYI